MPAPTDSSVVLQKDPISQNLIWLHFHLYAWCLDVNESSRLSDVFLMVTLIYYALFGHIFSWLDLLLCVHLVTPNRNWSTRFTETLWINSDTIIILFIKHIIISIGYVFVTLYFCYNLETQLRYGIQHGTLETYYSNLAFDTHSYKPYFCQLHYDSLQEYLFS